MLYAFCFEVRRVSLWSSVKKQRNINGFCCDLLILWVILIAVVWPVPRLLKKPRPWLLNSVRTRTSFAMRKRGNPSGPWQDQGTCAPKLGPKKVQRTPKTPFQVSRAQPEEFCSWANSVQESEVRIPTIRGQVSGIQRHRQHPIPHVSRCGIQRHRQKNFFQSSLPRP